MSVYVNHVVMKSFDEIVSEQGMVIDYETRQEPQVTIEGSEYNLTHVSFFCGFATNQLFKADIIDDEQVITEDRDPFVLEARSFRRERILEEDYNSVVGDNRLHLSGRWVPDEFIYSKGPKVIRSIELVITPSLMRKLDASDQNFLYDMPRDKFPHLFGAAQAIADPRKISFFNKPEQYLEWERLSNYQNETAESNAYRERVAVMTRPGRFFKKFGIEDPQRLEYITSLFIDYDLEVVTGEDIRKFYRGGAYTSHESTTLHSSCMKYTKCQPWFDIYVENCDMLIAKDPEGKIYGRAIIWKNVELVDHDSPITFMDRIYGSDAFVHSAKRYAQAQGWYHKTQQNYCSHQFVTCPDGSRIEDAALRVPIDKTYDHYPYMDTMSTLTCNETDVANCRNWGAALDLDDTEGGGLNDIFTSCSCCSNRIYEDDIEYLPDDSPCCSHCYNDQTVECHGCWDRHWVDDVIESVEGNFYCERCADRRRCEVCGIVVDDLITNQHTNQTVCESCNVNIDELEEENDKDE